MRPVVCLCIVAIGSLAHGASPRWELHRDDELGQLKVSLDGREALVYQYGREFALPHYWPVRSPSGKLMTVQRPDPYPHHQSIWIADKIRRDTGQEVDFYHCWKNFKISDEPTSGFRHFIRHQEFVNLESSGIAAKVEAKLQWIVDETIPAINETRTLHLLALGEGEYLLDLAWELTPSEADVAFASDAVHYAWPYVRMHPQFSGENGGTITGDRGNQGQGATDGKTAEWIDYSNVIDGRAEGLAILLYPDGKPHKWLTREYGAFGPRRADGLSGTGFMLPPGETLKGRVGILIHQGDAASGRIAERYQQYIEGTLTP